MMPILGWPRTGHRSPPASSPARCRHQHLVVGRQPNSGLPGHLQDVSDSPQGQPGPPQGSRSGGRGRSELTTRRGPLRRSSTRCPDRRNECTPSAAKEDTLIRPGRTMAAAWRDRQEDMPFAAAQFEIQDGNHPRIAIREIDQSPSRIGGRSLVVALQWFLEQVDSSCTHG